jgi:hypothetical protein
VIADSKTFFEQLPQHSAAKSECFDLMKLLVLDGRFDLRDCNSRGETLS